VRWVGPQPYGALPGYLRLMDVGVVPYRDSAFNRGSFPLKTLEYLAAGRGVVATDRWHQAGMALLFGMITGFGAAHFYYTRAWVRGLALALIQLSATKVLGHSMNALGLVILARLVDVVGVLWLFWYGRDE